MFVTNNARELDVLKYKVMVLFTSIFFRFLFIRLRRESFDGRKSSRGAQIRGGGGLEKGGGKWSGEWKGKERGR